MTIVMCTDKVRKMNNWILNATCFVGFVLLELTEIL